MRKASKKAIAANLKAFEGFSASIMQRTNAITLQAGTDLAQKSIADDLAEVRKRITEGDLSICTNALIQHIHRTVKNCETGFYTCVKRCGDGLMWGTI